VVPIADKITTYSVSVFHNDILQFDRQIRLGLASGGMAFIGFPTQRPANWLQFVGASTILYMTAADFDDVYRLIQSESPVFFTALSLLGLRTASVHTELDLSAGEVPGEGDEDPQSLEGLIRRALKQDPTLATKGTPRPRAARNRRSRRKSRHTPARPR
jgi:hypothetical protein